MENATTQLPQTRIVLNKEIRKLLKITFSGFVLVFIPAMTVLLARHLNYVSEVPVPSFRQKGPENAPVQITEYTDFACPGCGHANQTLHTLFSLYPGKIHLKFKHYPLKTIHKWSLDAAIAADCAGKQGKFWDYADRLFETQEKWNGSLQKPGEFLEIALKTGIKKDIFESCLSDTGTIKAVEMDCAEGDFKDIHATPTFFINKERVVGPKQLLEKTKFFDRLSK